MNQSILKDSGLEKVSSILDTKLFYAKELCDNLINTSSIHPNTNNIISTQSVITSLRNLNKEDTSELNNLFETFAKCESDAKFFFEEKKS